jgi:gastricsin
MNKRGGNYTLMSDAALIDSGTSLMLFPEEDFNNILAILKLYEKNCVYKTSIQQIMCYAFTNEHFPTIHINLCGKELDLKPDDYMSKVATKQGQNEYLVGFSSIKLQSGAKLTILGALFMKEYYTLFNQDDMKIGFVKAAR